MKRKWKRRIIRKRTRRYVNDGDYELEDWMAGCGDK